ncbi:MAG: type I glyceraldehyde-3-phosphate dehydrogenase [Bacilli bacterium]|nr:type I glyceraldehyde-3-phosphate dehydrogenase [Bacilli bacterium]
MIKVAINGFGRIGRLAFRELLVNPNFKVVAINDLSTPEELAYLLKYDTNHRSFHENIISFNEKNIIINDSLFFPVYKETDPHNLPWFDLDVDVVLECSGHYTKYEDAYKHIEAGAKKVLISAPGKGNMKTIVYGVNEDTLDGSEKIISAASCTTNCLAPMLKVINDHYQIKQGFMSTIHAYTNDQATLDIAHKKGIYARRGRACAANIVPASTGAASAIGEVIPSLKGKMDGIAYRVPVSDGSLVDCTLILGNRTTKEDINNTLMANKSKVLGVTNDPIVSSDVIGKSTGCLVDLLSTNVLDVEGHQIVKLVAWYDNEYGYTCQMLRTLGCLFK